MASPILWSSATSIQTVLASELDGLVTNTSTSASSTIDNRNGNPYADFEIFVTFASAPAAYGAIALMLAELVDGSTSPTNVAQGQNIVWAGSTETRAVTSAQRFVFRNVPLPPERFMVAAYNGADKNFIASTNTVKMITYSEEAQ